MDWSLVIFIVVILLFAWRGFRSGFVGALGRVLAVIAGYAAAILWGAPGSSWLEMQFGLQGLIALGAASLGLFLGAGLGVIGIFSLLQRHVFADEEISTASAVGGGFVGALVGVLLAIAIVWSFALVRDMRAPERIATAAPAASSGVERLASRLAGSAVSTALSAGAVEPGVARLGGEVMARPVEVMQRAQRLMTSPEFQTLMHDPGNRQVLDSGDPEQLRQLPAFRALSANPDMLALTEMAGFHDGGDVEARLARQFSDTWARARRVKNDARVQAILADPEFRAALESGDPLPLLTNPRVFELAGILFDDEPTPGQAAGATDGSVAAEPTAIYQWTDSSGRVHYSDQKPAD